MHTLMRMEIPPSLCCHPRLCPCHQLSKKVKSLKFCLLSFFDAGQCQAVKQSNTKSLLTINPVPLFSSSEHSTIIFLLLFVSSVFESSPVDDCKKLSSLLCIYDAHTYYMLKYINALQEQKVSCH